jgi:predicted CopG family antitoxin
LGSKNIAISDEAYRGLKSLKKPGESFTDLIERMTKQKGILDFGWSAHARRRPADAGDS